jgi:hypothetical protein
MSLPSVEAQLDISVYISQYVYCILATVIWSIQKETRTLKDNTI